MSIFKKHLKIGDSVKLITGIHGDSSNNPVWGGSKGKLQGFIIEKNSSGILPIEVIWENGEINQYCERDLELLTYSYSKYKYVDCFGCIGCDNVKQPGDCAFDCKKRKELAQKIYKSLKVK